MVARKWLSYLALWVTTPTYQLLGDLFAPDKPNTKSFEELVEKLKAHFQPTPTVIAETYRFHQRSQQKGETVTEYLAALRRLAKDCKFENFLERALRDRLVCGLASETIRKELLKERDLTLADVCKKASAMETAEADSTSMGQKRESATVNRLQDKGGRRHPSARGKQNNCYRCGKPGHSPEQCRFKTAQCFNCGKEGHTRDACRSKITKKSSKSHSQKQIVEESDTSEDEISGLNELHDKSRTSQLPPQAKNPVCITRNPSRSPAFSH